jgi:putative endonuclease
MTANPERRRRAERQGRGAERLAGLWLRAKGFGILASRFQSPQGEIDLIARRGRLLLFVEVKARSDDAAAAEAVTARQRSRIERAAQAFLQRRPELAACEMRFDAVLIRPGRLPRHIKDAWRPHS